MHKFRKVNILAFKEKCHVYLKICLVIILSYTLGHKKQLEHKYQFADSPSNVIDAGYNCSLQIKHKTTSV